VILSLAEASSYSKRKPVSRAAKSSQRIKKCAARANRNEIEMKRQEARYENCGMKWLQSAASFSAIKHRCSLIEAKNQHHMAARRNRLKSEITVNIISGVSK